MAPLPPPLLVDSDRDVSFESTLRQHPLDVDVWLEFAQGRDAGAPRAAVFERALSVAPGSFKLWRAYLEEREAWLGGGGAAHDARLVDGLTATYRRALRFTARWPGIWIMFMAHLRRHGSITDLRRALDLALQFLPVTQHHLLWNEYADFLANTPEVPWQTCERGMRRLMAFDPVAYTPVMLAAMLVDKKRYAEASRELLAEFRRGDVPLTQRKALAREISKLVCAQPEETRAVCNLDAVVRARMDFPRPPAEREADVLLDEEDRTMLWMSLADMHVRSGEFQGAREVYEDALSQAQSLRGFTLVFEAYSQFEETLAEATIDQEDELGANFIVARLENLEKRRQVALARVLLKSKPDDVDQWLSLAQACVAQGNVPAAREALEQAVGGGKVTSGMGSVKLWLELARLPVDGDRVAHAREVLTRAVLSSASRDALEELWCARIEFELSQGAGSRALALARESVVPPPSAAAAVAVGEGAGAVDSTTPSTSRSVRLWNLLLDLETSLGTPMTVRAAYDRAMEVKVVTPLMVLTYASWLRDAQYFEDSFTLFEKAVALFAWPQARDLWLAYTFTFVERYGGTKVEYARDLFEQALTAHAAHVHAVVESGSDATEDKDEDNTKLVYVSYGQFEEQYGSMRRALKVYGRWCDMAPRWDKFEAVLLLARRTEFLSGAASVRAIWEGAIDLKHGDMDEADVVRCCMEYAALEQRLGELARARALLVYAAQMSDPVRDVAGFWPAWNDFELEFGDEDSFTDMLRVKRSVAAHFDMVHDFDRAQQVVGIAAAGGGVGAVPAATGDGLADPAAIELEE